MTVAPHIASLSVAPRGILGGSSAAAGPQINVHSVYTS
jgi:hypothetical protein